MRTEASFSKLTSGTHGFPIDLLDCLPETIVLDFYRRHGQAIQRDPAELADQLLAVAEAIVAQLGPMREHT